MSISDVAHFMALVTLTASALGGHAVRLPALLAIKRRGAAIDPAASQYDGSILVRDLLDGETADELVARLKNPFKKSSTKSSPTVGGGGAHRSPWLHTEGDNLFKYRKARNWADTKEYMTWYSEAACTSF